jgi:hypothetical protein
MFAPHQLRNSLPAAVTYQQATAGDNPAPLPPQQQQQQLNEQQQQQQQLQASNEVAIDDVDFFDFEGALQASRYSSSSIGTTRGSNQDISGTSSSSSQQQQQQQQQQRLSLLRQVGRPVNESMSDFPSGGLELVKHFNLDGIFLEKQVCLLFRMSWLKCAVRLSGASEIFWGCRW